MENNFQIFLERVLLVEDFEKKELREIRIQIGRPYWTEPGIEAACPIAIQGYLGRLADIHGIDPMDALTLTISFVDKLLREFPEKKRICWPSGDSYFE